MKAAVLERQLGNLDVAISILDQAIGKFPNFDKLHMIRGQILTSRNEIPQARMAYAQGCKACQKSVPLWILAARLEEKAGVTIKARSLLEKARLYNPKNEDLWAESVKIEERAGGAQQAKSLLARGEYGIAFPPTVRKYPLADDASQRCKNARHRLCYGQWLSSSKRRSSAKADRSTHSKRPASTQPSSCLSLACSGQSARSKRPGNGWGTRSLRIKIGGMRGDGG